MIGAWLYPQLPDQLPTHWNINGDVDGWMPKQYATWLFPTINLGILVLFQILPKMDPKHKNYHLFSQPWQVIQTILIIFFAYIYLASLYVTFKQQPITPFIFYGIGAVFIVIGNYLGKVRQNYFLGIRTPWTLNNEDNWNKTQRFGGWMFVGAGLIILASGIFKFYSVSIFFLAVMIAALLPMVYSYLLYKKNN